MQLNTGALSDSGNTLAQVGTAIQQAAETRRSSSALGRTVSAVTALTVGARAVPGMRRLIRRNPVLGPVLAVATIGALVLICSVSAYARKGAWRCLASAPIRQ